MKNTFDHPLPDARGYFGEFGGSFVPSELQVIIDEITERRSILERAFYLVIKQEDLVTIIKKGKQKNLRSGNDYGILAYNENPLYEVIENGDHVEVDAEKGEVRVRKKVA